MLDLQSVQDGPTSRPMTTGEPHFTEKLQKENTSTNSYNLKFLVVSWQLSVLEVGSLQLDMILFVLSDKSSVSPNRLFKELDLILHIPQIAISKCTECLFKGNSPQRNAKLLQTGQNL